MKITVTPAWNPKESPQDVPGWLAWFINHSRVVLLYCNHERRFIKAICHGWDDRSPGKIFQPKRGQTRSRIERSRIATQTHRSKPEPAHSLVEMLEQR